MTPNCLEALQLACREGKNLDYVFFWGHQARAGGQLGPSCLSQWWPASFALDGVCYQTAEHYMMAEKARLFGDDEMRGEILAAEHPAEAKALGRRVSGFDGAVWAARRFDIVVAGNVAKFGQDEGLRAYLLGTSSRVLVEASPVDRIWGIGLAADDERAKNPLRWRGLNLLGFALMEARHKLA